MSHCKQNITCFLYSTVPQISEYYGFEGITQKNVKTDTQTTLGM